MRYLYLSAILTAASAFAADVKVMEEIVAKVNGDIITRTELDRDRRGLEASLKQQGVTGPRFEEALKQSSSNLLRERVDQLLLIQKGKELTLNVDSDVNKEMAEIQRRVTAQDPGMADPDKFQAMVREQTGMSFEDYKAETKNRYISQRVVREEGLSAIIVEQNPKLILPITQRAVVLDRGAVVHEGASAALLADPAQLERWLAVARAETRGA